MSETRKERSFIDFFSLRGVVLVTAFYGLIHGLIWLSAGTQLGLDEAKENIFTQTLEWGYLPDNPPLFEWSLIAIQQITGPTLFSFLILKYALLCFSAGFLFLAGKRLFGEAKWAAITVFSASLLYQLGYNYHQAFTHSLMVIAMVSFSFWAFVRLLQERALRDYLVFGLSIGLGLLAKYNFIGFLAAVLLPALVNRQSRKVLLDGRMLAGLGVAGLVIFPHGLWLLEKHELMLTYVSAKLGQNSGDYFSRVGEGLGDFMVATVSFYLPFMLVAFGVYREAFLKNGVHVSAQKKVGGDALLLFLAGRSVLWGGLLLLGAVLVLGVSNITERYVVPLYLPGFFALMNKIRLAEADRTAQVKSRQMQWLGWVGGIAVLLLIVRFVGVFYGGPPVCGKCQRWIPYDDIKQAIVQAGLSERAIYIGYEENTAGNLRRLFPRAKVRSVNLLFYQPIKTNQNTPCYFVWSEELLGQKVAMKFRDITNAPETINVIGQWQHPFREKGWRTTLWGVSPVPKEHPYYKTLCTAQ